MSNFDPNAILRGAQLTVVGTVRALRNPELFQYRHFQQAAVAVITGIIVELMIQIPVCLIRKQQDRS